MIAAACINNAGKNKLVNDGSAPLAPLTVVTTRPPLPGDAAAVAQLVRQTETLEPNSTYAYLLLCTHFAETSVVAEGGGALVGCALGYRVPSRPHTLFIWQIGVHPTAQRRGVALRLLDDLMRRPALRDVTHLETTITPSNVASHALFERWARAYEMSCTHAGVFESSLFGATDHEPENLYRIGPKKKAL